ncbi:MAG: hypothetical protein NT080_14450 [Spirochaetes bacterium]|nr:hypothetical protein [Spirochaetota bacterium]
MTVPNDVATLLADAYDKLKSADLPTSIRLLDTALSVDFENEEVLFALTCAQWWRERFTRTESMHNSFEKADFVLSQWKSFQAFQRRTQNAFEPARYAFKRFVFGSALAWYEAAAPCENVDAETALRLGRCLKGMGDFRKAVERLEAATNARKDDPETLAELADTYALVNETRVSKALFREAFFINPQRVNLGFLESTMIERLVESVAAQGFNGPELAEWLPVYGCLSGVFNVKRELKAAEVGRLKQSIYELENEAGENAERRGVLVPRLMNKYFWLVDHMINVKEDRARIDEVLLKVRILDPGIYRQYVS